MRNMIYSSTKVLLKENSCLRWFMLPEFILLTRSIREISSRSGTLGKESSTIGCGHLTSLFIKLRAQIMEFGPPNYPKQQLTSQDSLTIHTIC